MANSAVPLFQQKLITYAQAPIGGVTYTTTGQNIDFIVPYGVKNVSILCVGGGGAISKAYWDAQSGGIAGKSKAWTEYGLGTGANGLFQAGTGARYCGFAGDGGGLSYVNNLEVTPGQILTVRVGDGSVSPEQSVRTAGDSSVTRSGTIVCLARGGGFPDRTSQTTYDAGRNSVAGIGDIRRNGGQGGINTFYASRWMYPAYNTWTTESALWLGGGGGAAGYGGNGGQGGTTSAVINAAQLYIIRYAATSGQGGGGAGGDHTNPGSQFPVTRVDGQLGNPPLRLGPFSNGYVADGALPPGLGAFLYFYVPREWNTSSTSPAGEVYENGNRGGGVSFNGQGNDGLTTAVSGLHTSGQAGYPSGSVILTHVGFPVIIYSTTTGQAIYDPYRTFTTGAVFTSNSPGGSGGLGGTNGGLYGGGAAATPKTWYGFDLDGPWSDYTQQLNGIPSPTRSSATSLGGQGFVRIMWGKLRSYPSTRTESSYD